jgi:FkbH-like protein
MKPTLAEIEKALSEPPGQELKPVHIAVLRNIVIEPLAPYLRYQARQCGLDALLHFGEYDTIVQESLGTNPEILHDSTRCIFLFTRLENLSWKLARSFAELSGEQVREEVDRIKDFIRTVATNLRKQTTATIIWHAFELPVHPSYGVLDSQMAEGQLATVRELNSFLQETLRALPQAFMADLNLCLADIGAERFYDQRLWHIGRAPYSGEALRAIAALDMSFIRPLMGRNRKCLALDCDDTLWGGIIGEDGIAGIKLGKAYPGSPYYEFQQEIVNLYHRGVLIALCTKNNEDDVWEVFRNHPDMLLKEEHIAAHRINWQDKAANLRSLAQELNIGLDSFVYLDDSDFELNLVRRELPEVATILLPKDQPFRYRELLAGCGLFDTLTLSEEDRQRGKMYRAEADRAHLRAQTTDLVGYYRSLAMEVEIRFPDSFTTPRIAQLTQKTNQFNLTTRRYGEADIKRFQAEARADVLSLRLRDRFGDSGIVGTCILRYEKEKAIIDTFLLSCRVLGRDVENVFLLQALKLAKKRGAKIAIGEYYATKKNAQVENFYDKMGFTQVDARDGADRVFQRDLTLPLPAEPDFLKITVSDVDGLRAKTLSS